MPGLTHTFSVVSSGSHSDLSERKCLPHAGASALFLQITEPGQAVPSACTQKSLKTPEAEAYREEEKPAEPQAKNSANPVPPGFDTSAIDVMVSPKSRRPVKHPAGSNDPQVHACTETSIPTPSSTKPAASGAELRGPTTRMKLSQLLRTASQQSSPGQPGDNPFAQLLINAAKALDAHPDSVLLDFLEDQCAVNIKCGSTNIVNPLDLRRSVTLLRSDHLCMTDNHSASPAAAGTDGPADTPNRTPGAVHSAPGARMAA